MDDDSGGGDDDSGGAQGDDDSATPTPELPPPCDAWLPPVGTGVVADPELTELSGLAVSTQNEGVLSTHEDSGGPPMLLALDIDGETRATVTITDTTNEDWEDLALGPCLAGTCLYVGDIGDRGGGREDFEILVLPEPILEAGAQLELPAEHLPFRYPGEPEDAEGLVVRGDGRPILVTKRRNATAGVYVLPEGAAEVQWLFDVPTGEEGEDLGARATGAALWPDGQRLLVRTYFHLWSMDVSPLWDGASEPVAVAGAAEPQGEAVAFDPVRRGFWQVSEWIHPTLWWVACAD